MKKIVLLGAYSAIVFETAKVFATQNAEFVLLGKSQEKLEQVAKDLLARGASRAEIIAADLANCEDHEKLVKEILEIMPSIDLVLLGYGVLGSQVENQNSPAMAKELFNINFISATSWLERFAAIFENEKSGTLAAITSVAGDRGRKSNYIYGSSKAALSTYLQGLRNRLHSSNVSVLDIKPGFVDTPMTAGFKKGLLFSTPQKVAPVIAKAIELKKDTLYVPWFWFWILLIIRNIPERIFKKLSI